MAAGQQHAHEREVEDGLRGHEQTEPVPRHQRGPDERVSGLRRDSVRSREPLHGDGGGAEEAGQLGRQGHGLEEEGAML